MSVATQFKFRIPAILIAGIFFSCATNTIDEVLEFSDSEHPPLRTTIDAYYTYTDSGHIQNTLLAAKIEQFQTQDSTYSLLSNGFELTFYDKKQKVDGKLTALNGFINGTNSLMIARDSVVFTNAEGETLRTEELIWQQDSGKVFTDKFVTIEKADGVIYGKGLVSDQNFTEYVITDVTGIIYIEEENNDEK